MHNRKLAIVEFRSLGHDGEKIMARFVLTPDRGIVVVGPTPHSVVAAEENVAGGLPGPGGRYVKRDAGMEFLKLLAPNFRGSYFWATPVVEMDEGEAMTSFSLRPRRPLLSDSDVRSSFTARALRRNRKILLVIAIPSWLATIPMWIGAVVTLDAKAFAMAAAFSVVAFLSARAYVRRRDVARSPLIRLIREQPDQIVWIYILRQRVSGLGAEDTVHVHGASRQMFLLHSLEASKLVAELAAWCPHAYVGWSRELEQAWSRDPTSLRRSAA